MAPTDEMMPTLPEPWEELVAEMAYHVYSAGTADEFGPKKTVDINHRAFEAERTLRVAILDHLCRERQDLFDPLLNDTRWARPKENNP